jgi:glucans biosynthesis protein C
MISTWVPCARRKLPCPVEAARPALSRSRFHAIDALRGAAMFLVVALHSALAYPQVKIPRLLWAVRDPSPHLGFDVFCWWAMGVSLPVFFLVGGFFAADIYEARGPRAFLRNRAKRILVPFLVASLTILPLSFFAWAFGWLISGRCTLREIRRMRFHPREIQPDLYGPAHLWFLEYLILMLLAFWIVRGLYPILKPKRRGGGVGGGWAERLFSSPWKPFILAVPTALILWVSRERVGLDAVLDRHNSFIPDPIRLLHHAVFFAVGVWLQGFRNNLGRLVPLGIPFLALSIPVFTCRAWLLHHDWLRPLDGPWSLVLVTSAALFAWLTVFGLLGAFQQCFDRPRSVIRYLADSSYWIYLCHFPIVGLAQADLFQVRAPTAIKFLIVLTVTLALGLLSYQLMVRHTAVGEWLHGRRDNSPADVAQGRVSHW